MYDCADFVAALPHIARINRWWMDHYRPVGNLFGIILENVWCGQEDSNFHGVSPTSTSSLRVYHSAMAAYIIFGIG